ncbi:Major Facilitator Superfamily protein [Pseudobutyrivibrio sp. ACV-2]|uniref:MFS transporter n=1 Tax=Pseudobutyrivibrio sp. ACV-2 TaxID=1520801 RepID=UPI00089C05D6|nr:MFS transporter [Pseudobutyrivibrio sp. ACV-2]SEA66916.1 Major Facilitator Superfamily protein [Pseudobutyrivibrio sp. ACV-2]
MQKINIKAQIKKLYCIDSFGALMIAGGSWVALLAARGFSTIEIGWFESIFHVVSMICEVPSGAVADVFGRKKSMVMAQLMSMLSALVMIFTDSFLSIAVAMGVSALSYNLASGTREALAYDSMKQAGTEEEYESFVSTDMIIYEVFSSLATLLAGVALMLGYKKAYLIDILMGSVALLFALSLTEVHAKGHENMDVASRFKDVTIGSINFIRDNRKARLIILYNALIGAVAVLIGFFLQAKLPEVGLKAIYLGPALFIIGISGAIGSKAITHFKHFGYKSIALISLCGVVFAILSVFMGNPYIMILGACVGAFADSFIEIRSDVVLNNMIPSAQRATLMSINSFTFSVIMIVMSPVFGLIFQSKI